MQKSSMQSRGSRKRSRYLDGVIDIDPRDYELLRKFLTEHGKLLPARLTGASARQQRQIKRAIRRARVMGLAL
jgi:small subunit ribosomal protein S18